MDSPLVYDFLTHLSFPLSFNPAANDEDRNSFVRDKRLENILSKFIFSQITSSCYSSKIELFDLI